MSSDLQDSPGPRKRVLVVSCLQFGVHTDTFKYCELLRNRYELTYLCLDQGLPRKKLDGVKVVYCDRRPLGKIELGLFLESLKLVRTGNFDLIFMRRTKYSFLLRLLCPGTPMVFDIRSGSIESSAVARAVEDLLIRFNALFFANVTVISAGLARRLKLPGKVHVLPLGADPGSVLTQRRDGRLHLVYLGTFKNRHIERTVEGVERFLDTAGDLDFRYTIIGFGSAHEVDGIREAISRGGLENVVEVRDRIDHGVVGEILADHDVGLAFTPRDPWFEFQPSTKVFEYLAAGLLCVATDNAANREMIDGRNGVLVDDTETGVCCGLTWAAEHLPTREPRAVADTIRDHSWAEIVENNLLPYLEEVMGR